MIKYVMFLVGTVLYNSQYTSCQDGTIQNEFFDIFETDFFEWRLAFRGTPGVKYNTWQVYNNKQTDLVEPGCKQVTSSANCTHHFRNNDVMDNWRDIDEVAFVVYEGGQRVAHILFDGKGSDPTNWFSDSRLVSSSWTDIKGAAKNYFSLVGDDNLLRHFFINRNYGGCPADAGWFVAVDGAHCSWEASPSVPAFLYAKNHVITNWTTGDVGRADVIAVFVKYVKSPAVGK